jgi:ribosomal-protein-alanine N-acetyltransferase
MVLIAKGVSLDDLNKLHFIEQQSFNSEAWSKRKIATFLQARDSVTFTARENDEILGFVIGLVNEYDGMKIGHIVTVDVLPKHRRKGIGKTLLKSIEQEFRSAGVKVSYLEVSEDNIAARRLYRQAGYSEIEKLENYYSRGGHGLRLEKNLLP